MRAVIQRVARARVTVEDREIAAIGRGALVLLGVDRRDPPDAALRLADKTARLRVFDDADGRMNLDARAAGGAFLVVSQFTLLADCRRGNRPSYLDAAPPGVARPLYEAFAARLRELGFAATTGEFGAHMRVELVNDGPVTVVLDLPPSAAGDDAAP